MLGYTLSSGALEADTTGLRVHLSRRPETGYCQVFFDGRRIWTSPIDAGTWEAGVFELAWPPGLVPRLRGYTRVRAEVFDRQGRVQGEAEARIVFDALDTPLLLCEPSTGEELVVNKWGRLAKNFARRGDGVVAGLLEKTSELISFGKRQCGFDFFLTGGTLLGAVREGAVMPADDDADLAYLSAHSNPSDIALESFALERALYEAGYEVGRHSTGHIQVFFPSRAGAVDFYVDIFTYFVCHGMFYGTFHVREPVERVCLQPLGTVDVSGKSFPAPAKPEQLLEAIYGPGWSVPDPAFRFVTPEAAKRRFYWWLNHFYADVEDWEDYHRALTAAGGDHRPRVSEQLWPAARLADSLLELGCGTGERAWEYARQGRAVLAVDSSSPGILAAKRSSVGPLSGRPPEFVHANLYSIRDTMRVLAAAAQLPGRVDILAWDLLDGVHWLGRDHVLHLCKHLLSRGGRAYFQVPLSRVCRSRAEPLEPPGSRVFEAGEFEHRLGAYGLEVQLKQAMSLPEGDPGLRYVIRKGK